MSLPTNPMDRKQRPLARGLLDYFPDALAEVAYCSWVGNEQHNPGSELHWDREKSTDEADALLRHLVDRGTKDDDGVRHSAKAAWRALALLQKEIENARTDERLDRVMHLAKAREQFEQDALLAAEQRWENSCIKTEEEIAYSTPRLYPYGARTASEIEEWINGHHVPLREGKL